MRRRLLSEWGLSKLLHWLRHNPAKAPRFVTALEHCDMVAATLCGINDPAELPRSVCAMGHKWMWNERWGDSRERTFSPGWTRCWPACATRSPAAIRPPTNSREPQHGVGEKLGLRAGIPIPTGAFDAHWDAVGANIRLGDVVNVIGTSTCIIGLSAEQTSSPVSAESSPAPSTRTRSASKPASPPSETSSAPSPARRQDREGLSEITKDYRAGQTGLLRLTWDNGDRTVLVNPELGGITLGWNLLHTAADELFAAIEGTASIPASSSSACRSTAPINRVIKAAAFPSGTPA